MKTESPSQRGYFASLIKRKSKDELELLFGITKSDLNRRTDAWESIAYELNSLFPENTNRQDQWRRLWSRLKLKAKKRLIDKLPLRQWESDIVDVYNMKAELLGMDDERIAEKVVTLPVYKSVDIAKCTPLQCAVLQQHLKDRNHSNDEDERWQRVVGVLNLLGPMSSASGWYAAIEPTKARTFTTTDELTDLEQQIRQILHQESFEEIHARYAADQYDDINCSPRQMDVLLYYLKLYPCIWSPTLDSDTATSAWQELTVWLNLLGDAQPMANWQSQLTAAVGRVRARDRVPLMGFNDRLLYNLARRTSSSVLDMPENDDPDVLVQRYGSVKLMFGRRRTDGHLARLVYQCSMCPQSEFGSSELLVQHIFDARHFDIEPVNKIEPELIIPDLPEDETEHFDAAIAPSFQCDICQRFFDAKWLLGRHMYVHIRQAKILARTEAVPPCSHCGRVCDTRQALRQHEALHNPNTDTVCEECYLPFVSAVHCGQHFNAVHMKSDGAAVEFAFTKVPGGQVEPGDRPFKRTFWWHCDPCNASFTTRQETKMHITDEHAGRADKDDNGDEQTKRYIDLAIKRMRRTTDQTSTYQCNLCEYSVGFCGRMRQHILLKHTEQSPYLCSRCPQTFRHRKELAKHRQTEHGDAVRKQEFVCDLCGQQFPLKASLKSHLFSAHSAQRPYKCLVVGCEQTFRWTSGRRRHYMTVHDSSGKPIGCTLCEQRFWTGIQLNAHMANEHPSETFQCELCEDRPELEWKDRRKHTKSFHPETMPKWKKKKSHRTKERPIKTFQCELCDDRPELEWKNRRAHMKSVHPQSVVRKTRKPRKSKKLDPSQGENVECDPLT